MKKLYLLLFLICLQLTTSHAQVSLIRKFNTCCGIGPFEPLNNKIIFNAYPGLWSSDGTYDGTIQLTTGAGFDNYSIRRCRVGNVIFFWGGAGPNGGGLTLWKTDGTPAGTVLVKEFMEGSYVDGMVNLNGILLFGYKTNAEGKEVWRSDGTEAGTHIVTDLVPGSGDGLLFSSPQSAVLGSYFYFQGPADPALAGTHSPAEGRPTLFRTDGTAAGTTMIANSGYAPQAMNVINGRLVYQASAVYTTTYGSPCFSQPTVISDLTAVLMVIDNGVASILTLPANVEKCGKSVPLGNTFENTTKFIKSSNYLYFSAASQVNSAATLWRTDGTPNGTIQLTTSSGGIYEGPFGGMFTQSLGTSDYNFGTIAYFPIYTNAEGGELWRSDGTPAGTYLLKDINPGPDGSGAYAYNGNSNPNNTSGILDPRTVNGITYFFANDGTHGVELWKTDGTTNGTQMVQDLNPGTGSQPISTNHVWDDNGNAAAIGSKYFFLGADGPDADNHALFTTCSSTPTLTITATPSLTITQGTTTTLKATGAATYKWNTGATTASITVSQAGSYSVTGTSAGGCPATTTVEVVTVPGLTLIPSASVQAGCVDGTGALSSILSVSVTGGVPPYSYTWLAPSGVSLNPKNTSQVSSTIATGIRTITVRVASAAGGPTSTATISVTANARPTPGLSGNVNLCAGQSTTLTASGGVGYQWSTGQSGASQVVSPTLSTVYSVTVTNESGCKATKSSTVSVNAVPKVVIKGSPSLTLTQGSSATLTASGATTYVWSTGATTPAIVVSQAGAYSVTGISSGGCSATATTAVTVTPSPLVLTPSASVQAGCVDGTGALSSMLSVSVTGGVPPYSYTWLAPSGVSLNPKNTSQVSSTIATGIRTITVRVASAAGGPTSTATISVTANARPTPGLSGNVNLCAGQSTTLTASGGVGYQWSTGQSGASQVVSPTLSTVYSVTVTNESGCKATKSSTVSVNALPKVVIKGKPTSMIIASGSSATLTASGATTYAWSNGATTPAIVVSEAGSYSVTGSSSAGCSATATAVVTVTGTVANGPNCDTYTYVTDSLHSISTFVRSVYTVGNTIYVATDGGLSISTNGGSSFTNYTTSNNLGSNMVFRVYVVGTKIYAATTNGLSISTDGGAHFSTTTSGLGSSFVTGVYSLGSTVFVSTLGGLGISTNGGISFVNKTTDNGLGHNTVYGVYAVGNTIYAATAGGVSISTNGGTSFTNTSVGTGNNYATSVYAVGNTVYAATYGGGLSISTNNGASYIHKTTADSLGSNTVWSVYALGNTIYAATATGLSISTNGGASFTNHYLNGHGVYDSYVANNIIYAATDGGLAYCGTVAAPRLGAAEPNQSWQVRLLGNPPVDEYAEVEVRDALGQNLKLRLSDVAGHALSSQSVEVQDAVQRVRVRLGTSTGIYLLQVSDGVRKQTVRILRP
ncbi:hypothetical protein GO755_14860 [Spirosoma sp. HMF4905]|uniref:PKD/Chitinase domain-containing protein n=1 Tax=Spirosoma arboris TaxID=2682092 RepID=A0A7K1SBX6_9BACT|nr:ELWxxDGT repeat protein [Spirosoma arboris]MVM31322.1 hypothetical protein [Spirosoma arboris]